MTPGIGTQQKRSGLVKPKVSKVNKPALAVICLYPNGLENWDYKGFSRKINRKNSIHWFNCTIYRPMMTTTAT